MKKPYSKFCSVGNTNYYYLRFSDLPYAFVGMEAVEEIQKGFKFPLLPAIFKIKYIPTSLRLMPLNTLVMFLLLNSTNINEITYEFDVDNNKIPIFGVWDDIDIGDLKTSFINSVLKVAGASNYDLPHTIHNLVARGLDKEGYHFFGIEKHGALNRTYWLVRTNKFGHIQIASVSEVGDISDPLTSKVEIYHLDKQVVGLICDNFTKEAMVSNKETKEMSKDVVEEKGEIN